MGGDVCLNGITEQCLVSIHASAWEATDLHPLLHLHAVVSIHASAWEATVAMAEAVEGTLFQSTPPHGRRPVDIRRYVHITSVSIHASAWRRPELTESEDERIRFQSTPPHGRRHDGICGIGLLNEVSIHASAWEATS